MFANIITFIILVFIYLHINNQLKRNEDLEISEMDYTDNENLQQICELKQPILFALQTEFSQDVTLDRFFEYVDNEIKVKECADENQDFILLSYKSANTLMITDTKSRYFSENNQEFIEEAGFSGAFEDADIYLKPALTVNTKHDFVVGSAGAVTPLRYHTSARKFICVNSGKITVKMTPWKSRKYLVPQKDFENYDFRSPVNPWSPQEEFADTFTRLRFLEFDVHAGYVLYVPPYWFYSIKLSDSPNNLACTFTYDNPVSFLTNTPNYFMYYLQQSNITKIMKKGDDDTSRADEHKVGGTPGSPLPPPGPSDKFP